MSTGFIGGPPPEPPVVGMIGGGQLARMTQQAAIALGIQLRLLAVSPRDSAAQVIRDTWLGAHDDRSAVLAFADGCAVVTFDHEHVPPAILDELGRRGIAIRPGAAALAHAQDKLTMRQALTRAGLPCPRWREIEQVDDLAGFAEEHGWPVVLKVSRGGYDGRGVWIIENRAEAGRVLAATSLAPGASWLAEQYVPFKREISVQAARSARDQAVVYPVVETVQTNGMCTEVIAPAPGLAPGRAVSAQRIALDVARALDVTGMLAVEMFDTGDELLINELAMRPHNSGHWTIDGAVTSQFENHLRAVLDLPLGSPAARSRHAVMVNILGGGDPDLYAAYGHVLARDPGLKVHLYGKEVRPGRKVGHVTVYGDDLDSLLARAGHAADHFRGVVDG